MDYDIAGQTILLEPQKQETEDLGLHAYAIKLQSPTTPLSRAVSKTDDSMEFTNPSLSAESDHSQSTARAQEPIKEMDPLQNSKDQENTGSLSSVNNNSSENLNIKLLADEILEKELELSSPSATKNLLVNHKSASTPNVQETLENHNLDNNNSSSSNNNVDVNDKAKSRLSNNEITEAPTTMEILTIPSSLKRRGTTRTVNSATGVEPFDGNGIRNRNSTVTTNSRNIDTASIEIERVRNSILSKREFKRKQKNSMSKHGVHYDDDNVLVGHKVSEGHVNYVVAYNMLTGIRVGVSRCSGLMSPLTDKDFKSNKKLAFDSSGNELTPSSKYDFKFKDYSPLVFRELRLLFGLDPADYLMSLTSKYILSELTSPGKSGSFFYYSRDYRFIIKTIHRAEHVQLRKILKDYYNHIKANPNTLLCQFYGLHRVKMPLSYGLKKRKIYFIVMNNLFPPHKQLEKTFDLKGSTFGRYTKVNDSDSTKNNHKILKDLNWIENKETIRFGSIKNELFLNQLKADVKLLIKLKIMDYSFLIGIHDLTKFEKEDDIIKNKKLSVFSPISSSIKDLKSTNLKTLDNFNDLQRSNNTNNNSDSGNKYSMPAVRPGSYFHSDDGGVISTDLNNENLDHVYYLGIIDCLTHYSIVKRLETFWRSLSHDRKKISAVPPKEYGERFLLFIENSINENNLDKMPEFSKEK